MRSAFALRISYGNYIFDFGVQKRLRAFLDPIFMGGGHGGKACACGQNPLDHACGVPAPERVQPAENKQNVNSAARMFPQETSAAASAFGYDSSREKAILENPQIFQNCEIK